MGGCNLGPALLPAAPPHQSPLTSGSQTYFSFHGPESAFQSFLTSVNEDSLSEQACLCLVWGGAPAGSSEGAWGSPGQPTLWSPTSEASFTDFTKLSFMK